MKRSIIKILLIFFAVFTLFAGSPAFSAQAPDFKLDGRNQTVQLSQYRGKVVYIDFWASWCLPCRKSFVWMNKMQSRYGDSGLKIIAINLDESKNDALTFLKKIPASFEIAFDPKGKTAQTYQIKAMPSSFIIDRKGNIVQAHLGFHGDDEGRLEAKIRRMIKHRNIANRQESVRE